MKLKPDISPKAAAAPQREDSSYGQQNRMTSPANQTEYKKTAVFIQTHFVNSHIHALYTKISSEAPPHHDVYILYNCGNMPLTLPSELLHLQDRVVLTNTNKLLALGYPRKCRPDGWNGKGWSITPGNCDLNIILFHTELPYYDYYWAIEYDVHFEGNWAFFFNRFAKSNSDLIGTTIYDAQTTPNKLLNPPLRTPQGELMSLDNVIRGFYPICRMSKAALEYLSSEYQKGWDGHQELLLGTLLKKGGMTIEDIGGSGTYVRPENVNAFYFNSQITESLSPGNFVFQPAFKTTLKKKNTLWHPLKPDGDYFNHSDQYKKGTLAEKLTIAAKTIIFRVLTRLWFLLIWKKQKDNQ